MKSFRLLIEGKVGRGTFQSWAMVAATELGLSGWVRNIADEQVELLLQGSSDAFTRFQSRLKEEAPIVELHKMSSSELDYDKVHDHFEMRG